MSRHLSRTRWWAHRKVSQAMCRVLWHHICCGTIPDWTAHVGREWKPLYEGGWNLYNSIWQTQHWIRQGIG